MWRRLLILQPFVTSDSLFKLNTSPRPPEPDPDQGNNSPRGVIRPDRTQKGDEGGGGGGGEREEGGKERGKEEEGKGWRKIESLKGKTLVEKGTDPRPRRGPTLNAGLCATRRPLTRRWCLGPGSV